MNAADQLRAAAARRILVKDGAYGTEIQRRKLNEAEYRGSLDLSRDIESGALSLTAVANLVAELVELRSVMAVDLGLDRIGAGHGRLRAHQRGGGAERPPLHIGLLFDTSGSMEERVSLARSAAIRFLDGLRPDDNVAIYKFDSKVDLVQEFSNSRDIAPTIFDVKARGMTRMNDAIYDAAVELSKRPEKRRAIIVLSDGQDNFSKRSSEKALKAALDADAVIYTVDMAPIGGSKRVQNQGPLKNFASKSGGTFVATPGGAALRDAFAKIVEELGVQYTIGYSPENTKKDGKWRKIELRVAKPGLTIRAREGYNAERLK